MGVDDYMSKQVEPKLDGILLEMIVYNPKMKSKHKCPCILPLDALDMTLDQLGKSYGPHLVNALHELLQHPSFRKAIAKPKLIVQD
jgi:hypothetical protein